MLALPEDVKAKYNVSSMCKLMILSAPACRDTKLAILEHFSSSGLYEPGELFSRTAYVFDDYWNNPEKAAGAFQGKWCSVGDIARRDRDGHIWLVDRNASMTISGGENVYPSAVVVLDDGNQVKPDEIAEWCRDRLAGYKLPRRMFIVTEEEMPRTASGKILHRKWRERYTEG